jgi:hypothetical protein
MIITMLARLLTTTIVLGAAVPCAPLCRAIDEFEQAPIEYSKSEPDNRVSKLISQLAEKTRSLTYDSQSGYLPGLLEALDVPVSSQMLVFSKTSMQRDRISPRAPRAIYFNDDVYIGYCRAGKLIEIASADPNLGAVFYTVEQRADASPAPTRQTQSCLQCHSSTRVDGIPGLLARSVFTGPGGLPILSEGSHQVDHTTPLKDRWGGWYVTGTHGDQSHLGNLIVRDRKGPRPFGNEQGLNATDLNDRIRTSDYLAPHSDIVALMVFEHQLAVHNAITKANFETRRALHYEAELNKALGEPAANRLESTTRRIQNVGDKLVEALLFSNEAELTAPISGSSEFAEQFSKKGPRDAMGRSLRDFDLRTRMFKYPCSYLIYSAAFDGLPDEMKSYVAQRMQSILQGNDRAEAFWHLTADDRSAVLEILSQTKPDLWSDGKLNPAN